MDRRPESDQPHYAEIRVLLYKAERRAGTDSVVGRSQGYRIGGWWVVRQTYLLSSSPNDPADDAHKRHRRVVNPAFGLTEAKGFVPHATEAVTRARELCWYFLLSSKTNTAPCRQMVDKWNDIIGNSETGYSAVIDVNKWLGKATLDACVLASVLGVRRLRTDGDIISQKVWCWSFRLRLWRLRREGCPVDQVLHERDVRPLILDILGPRFPSR